MLCAWRREGVIDLKRLAGLVRDFLFPQEEPDKTGSALLEEALAEAYGEWVAAQMLFEENADPDMIDFTIYNLKAAEHRYCYLLRKAKREHAGCGGNTGNTPPARCFETCLFL